MNASTLSAAPLLPWPILAPLLAFAALPVLYAMFRRSRGSLLRGLACATLAALLVNPSLVRERRDPIKDVAVVLVDRSQSQTLGDRAARTDAALAHVTQALSQFLDLDTRVVTIGGDSAGTGETDMFAPLQQVAADIPRSRLAGVIALTDGQVHDVPANPADAATYGPFQALLTGVHHERDRRISIVNAPAYGIVAKSVQVTIRVDDTPGIDQPFAEVAFSQDGAAPQMLTVPVGQDYKVDVSLPHEGKSIVTFEATPVAGELTIENNRTAAVINAVRDRLKVLLISGEPYPGERTWRNLLKGDPSVDLVHFTILRPPEKQDATPVKELSLIAFPIRELFETKLRQFDLIIFDRYQQMGLLPQSYYRNIVRYVEGGGALLDASGPDLVDPMSLYFTPLGDLMPATPLENVEGAFKPMVTDLGKRHPVTANLPQQDSWGRWFRETDVQPRETDPAKTAVVMAGAKGRPLLLLGHYGDGRVAQLASDQIWLWARGYDGGGPYSELMRRIAHWLMKEPALEEDDLRAHMDGRKLTVDRVSLKPGGPAVTVTAPSGASETVTLTDKGAGIDSGVVEAKEIGVYKVSDGRKNTFVIAGSLDSPEFRDVLTTEDKLKPVADASGGSIHWLEDHPAIDIRRMPAGRAMSGGSWIGLKQNGQYTVSGVDQTPLMPPLLALLALIALLMWGWRREGQ